MRCAAKVKCLVDHQVAEAAATMAGTSPRVVEVNTSEKIIGEAKAIIRTMVVVTKDQEEVLWVQIVAATTADDYFFPFYKDLINSYQCLC